MDVTPIGPRPYPSLLEQAATAQTDNPNRPTAIHRKLIQAVRAVNHAEMLGENYELRFALDPESHKPLLRIINRETEEVVDQIPPEYLLQLSRDLDR